MLRFDFIYSQKKTYFLYPKNSSKVEFPRCSMHYVLKKNTHMYIYLVRTQQNQISIIERQKETSY